MSAKSTTVRRSLMLSVASFLSMTVICSVLCPQIFQHPNYGISYFGSVQVTLVPYYTGFLIATVCLTVVAYHLRSVERRFLPLQMIFWVAGILMMLVALTSYSQSSLWLSVHNILAILLVTCELAAGIWIVKQPGSNTLDYAVLGLFIVVYIISSIPSAHTLPVLSLFPLREVVIFMCALGLTGRMALRAVEDK